MKNYTIATIVKVKNGHVWFDRMEAGVEKFAKETGHRTFLTGPPQADEGLQEDLIKDAIAQGVDAICVVPFFPQALELSLRKARHQGIIVISHEASHARNVDYDLEAFDNSAYGAHLMDHLAQYMGKAGEYAVLMGNLTAGSHSEWAEAAIFHQQQHYPEMTLATKKIEDHDNPDIAADQTRGLLDRMPNVTGILGIGMSSTIGAGNVVAEQHLQNTIMVVGTGLVAACKENLRNGAINLISFWDPADAGYAMNALAVQVLEKQTIQTGLDLGVAGFHHLTLDGKVLYGEAWVDVTKATMTAYDF